MIVPETMIVKSFRSSSGSMTSRTRLGHRRFPPRPGTLGRLQEFPKPHDCLQDTCDGVAALDRSRSIQINKQWRLFFS